MPCCDGRYQKTLDPRLNLTLPPKMPGQQRPMGQTEAALQDALRAPSGPYCRATHAIRTQVKAGDTACHTLFVLKLQFQTPKTLSQTLLC